MQGYLSGWPVRHVIVLVAGHRGAAHITVCLKVHQLPRHIDPCINRNHPPRPIRFYPAKVHKFNFRKHTSRHTSVTKCGVVDLKTCKCTASYGYYAEARDDNNKNKKWARGAGDSELVIHVYILCQPTAGREAETHIRILWNYAISIR